jgi:hypothetical protein
MGRAALSPGASSPGSALAVRRINLLIEARSWRRTPALPTIKGSAGPSEYRARCRQREARMVVHLTGIRNGYAFGCDLGAREEPAVGFCADPKTWTG